jgi:peptidoglycan/xylan/chitin deacetylase (PgdA/CDA1 family)
MFQVSRQAKMIMPPVLAIPSMKATEIVSLMYHEIRMPHRPLSRSDQGYRSYAVHSSNYKAQLTYLKQNGILVYAISDLLNRECVQPGLTIAFDDGSETDLLEAAPLLCEIGFPAIFYIVSGFVGQKSYLSSIQLRELANMGFEIGSHSMTHAFLTDIPEKQLHEELAGSKGQIEQIIGKSVDHFSCPGGRWNKEIAYLAREAGYRSMATSRIGVNSHLTDPFQLARIPILAKTKLDEFADLVAGRGLFGRRVRSTILSAAKWTLGNQLCHKIYQTFPR